MKASQLAAAAAAVVLFSGLAGRAQIAAAPAPSAAASAPESHVAPPPSGKGQVVFFRTGAYAGAATFFKIRENGQELAKLTNASWVVVPVDPGVHTFTSATENKTKLTLEIDAGETYYVRGTLHMGLLLYEVSLSPADDAMFELHYKHMHQRPAGGDAGEVEDAAKPVT